MNQRPGVWRLRVVGAAGLALAVWGGVAQAADLPAVAEFAWRGTLTLPAAASLVRVEVPVAALLHMQSNNAQDLRIFNAAGSVVPFSVLGAADVSRSTPVLRTVAYPAYPMFSAVSAGKPGRGEVEVQLTNSGQRSSAWVRFDQTSAAAKTAVRNTQPLQAALFDMRSEKLTVSALELMLDLPVNTLIPITVATSRDLKEWTDVPTNGPLFRFDGADAPLNTTLELRQTLPLPGRYVKLAWPGHEGVALRSLTGRVASSYKPPAPLRTTLPPGLTEGTNSLKWTLPFATPIAALHLQAGKNNSLVPVRIQGRSDASQPWRTLASSLVYRLDTVGEQGSSNPPTPLYGASVRTLRVETNKGITLPEGGLQATLEFAPLQVAFLASGGGPFTLAVGRPNTSAAAMEASLLGSITPAKWVELPLATVANVQTRAPPTGNLEALATRWLPEGVPLRSMVLWVVLGVGVLVLGGVAYSLMRQLAAKR